MGNSYKIVTIPDNTVFAEVYAALGREYYGNDSRFLDKAVVDDSGEIVVGPFSHDYSLHLGSGHVTITAPSNTGLLPVTYKLP